MVAKTEPFRHNPTMLKTEGTTMNRTILNQYTTAEGLVVTVYKPRAPRRSERTWVASKGSVAQLGAKGANLRNAGLAHAKG